MSALITAEWYMRKNHFPGWARPFEFNAQLYDSIGRHEEARDGVSCCISLANSIAKTMCLSLDTGIDNKALVCGAAGNWLPVPCKQLQSICDTCCSAGVAPCKFHCLFRP